MSEADDVAALLAQVVDLGPTPQEVDLGAAVAQQLANRPSSPRPPFDPNVAASLRSGHCPTCGRAYQQESE